MNDIADSSIMNALGRQMTRAVAKQLVAAGNLANLDTPGYRTREVSFDDALDQQLQTSLTPAASGHSMAGAAMGSGPSSLEAEGLPGRRDGNNVQLDRELLDMTKRLGRLQRRADGAGGQVPARALRHQRGPLTMSEPERRPQRQRQRPDRRADPHRSRRLEPRQRRVDARGRRPAVSPSRRRPRHRFGQHLRRRAGRGAARSASRSRRSSRIRRRFRAATTRRIPTPTAKASWRMPNVDAPEEMVDMLSAPRAPIRRT